MQTSNDNLPAAEYHPREERGFGHLRVWAVSVSVFVVIAALSVSWMIRDDNSHAFPPTIDLKGVSPRVVAAMTTARDFVLDEPASGKAWGHLAMVLRAHEFETEANTCFAEAEHLDPHDFRWPYLRGVSLAVIDPQAAIDCYQRSVEIRPDLPLPRLRMAELYIALYQLEQAETHLRSALDLDPGNPRTLLDLGRVAFLRGDLQESLDHTTKSAMLAPMKRATHELLSQIYHRMEDREAAAEQLAIVQQIPEDEMGWHDPFVLEVLQLRRDPDWIVIGVACVPIIAPVCRSSCSVGCKSLAVAVVVMLVGLAFAWPLPSKEDSLLARVLPRQIKTEEFSSSDSCRSCHPGQYASWRATYHRTMTQIASPTTVLAPFDEIELESRGRRYRLWRRGDEFWVTMADPDWEVEMYTYGGDPGLISDPPMVERRIVMTTGSHHIQCYWVASRNGNELRQLPWQYHIQSKRWIPSEDTTLKPPDGQRHFGHWNSSCIPCHSLGGKLGLDLQTGHLFSQVSEFGISCEACHGPGRKHIRHHSNPLNRYQQHLSGDADPTIVNPESCSSKVSSQICGQCHSTFLMTDLKDYFLNGDNYRAGDELEQSRLMLSFKNPDPRMIDDARNGFWRDGTTRIGGREYLGLVQSPCFQRGEMSCLSCHSMHRSHPDDQLASRMQGDHACLQCHTTFRGRIEEHTHHRPGSPGSRCYNCHMPHTTYALFKAIRSHRIDSPSALTSVRTGKPNACNLCHLDKPLGWTAKQLTEWYGTSPVDLDPEENQIAASLLWLLRGDAAQRVITAWHMGWEPAHQASGKDWQPPFLAQLLVDPYSAVRFVTYRSLQRFESFNDFQYDFIGSPQQRSQAKSRALKVWKGVPTGRANRIGMRDFFDSNDKFLQKVVDRVLQQRDDRPVTISE